MLAPMHLPPIGALADVYPVLERRGGAGPLAHEPLAAILSRTRSPSSQRARAKVDEGPFASLNATRRKLTPGTRLAISALHLPAGQLHIMGRDQGGKPGRPDDRVERLENMDRGLAHWAGARFSPDALKPARRLSEGAGKS